MLKKRDGKSSMPSEAQIVAHLQRANEVAKLALANGFHPFGAILVAPNHTTVLLEQGNLDQVGMLNQNSCDVLFLNSAQRSYGSAPSTPLWNPVLCALERSIGRILVV